MLCLALPNQSPACVLDHLRRRVEQLFFEVFERLIIKGELPLERPVRQPAFWER